MSGWLQDGSNVKTYGKPFLARDGIEYVHTLPAWQRPLYRFTVWAQWLLWKLNVPWHNCVFDECTPTGNCCPRGGDLTK